MENNKSFSLEVTVNTTREKVWETIYTRFGDIHVFNPNLDGSHCTAGTTSEVGTVRQCNLDSKTFIQEKILSVDDMKGFTIDLVDGNMPLLNQLQASFKLETVTASRTKVILSARFNTKPFFMAALMKGAFKKKMSDMLVGLKYYLETGNKVSKRTFKPIARQYQKLQLNQSFY
jgi:hypothetical protein